MLKLERAFSYGFHGIHFIPIEYESIIELILEQYLGKDHYISYRECKRHNMLVLQPNYHKLGLSPMTVLKSSYKTSKKIHALQNQEEYASFCYE
jgi:hypothetical protein